MDNPYYEKLVNAALRYISYRPRSEKELTGFLMKKLVRWKVSGDTLVAKVVNRMRELGYVDDRSFATWWRDQRTEFNPKGSRLIALELAGKGVSREIIRSVLSRQNDGENEINELMGAQKAIRKKIVLWARLPIFEQKKKVYTFLAQRGFSSDTIEKIIDEKVKKD